MRIVLLKGDDSGKAVSSAKRETPTKGRKFWKRIPVPRGLHDTLVHKLFGKEYRRLNSIGLWTGEDNDFMMFKLTTRSLVCEFTCSSELEKYIDEVALKHRQLRNKIAMLRKEQYTMEHDLTYVVAEAKSSS